MATEENTMRRRIITHMNKDHRDSVARYIEHQCGASRFAARNARMRDISLDQMIVFSGGKDYIIKFEPPLKSFNEARDRVIEMDKAAVVALKRSPVSVKEFWYPKGFHLVVWVVCAATYVLLTFERLSVPGSALAKAIPPLATLVHSIRLKVLFPMLVIHGTEAYYMTKKMKKHSVPLFSDIWVKWVFSNFVEGVGAYQRLDALVKRQEAKQRAAKH